MSAEPRFTILPYSPMALRDSLKEENIHLGSQYEARELCELLNTLWDLGQEQTQELIDLRAQTKNQSLTLLRVTAELKTAESELLRVKKLAEINKFQL